MKTALSLVCKIGIALVVMWVATHANAASTSNDQSSVKLNLDPSWKIRTNPLSFNMGSFTKTVDYINTFNSNPETLQFYKQMKGQIGVRSGKEIFPFSADNISQLHAQQKNMLTNQMNCQVEDDTSLTLNSKLIGGWGIFWQCPNKKGFTFFIYADPDTAYTITYKADNNNSSISPAEREHMTTLLNAMQICFKNVACEPLFNSTNTH